MPILAFLLPKPDLRKGTGHVRVVLLHNSQRPKTAQKRHRRADKEEKKQQEDQKEARLEGQVVDIPPTADDRAPDDAEFLSEHNTRVDRQTRSRHQSARYQNAMNEPTVAQKTEEAASPASAAKPAAIDIGPEAPERHKQGQEGDAPAFELPRLRQRDRLALPQDNALGRFRSQSASDELLGSGERVRLALNAPTKSTSSTSPGGAATQAPPSLAKLLPEIGVLARVSGGPAPDHLDLEEGEGTFLNSREFKFSSFFNRMKRGVSQHWQPFLEYRRRDPTGNIYGHRSRSTVLNVTLRADGSLQNVEVTKSSGVDFLDREAILAFRRAEPFPNPPRALVGEDGNITFPFGFFLDFNRSGGFRLPF